MVFTSFIDSSDYGSGEFESRLHFSADVWAFGFADLRIWDADEREVKFTELSHRDKVAIACAVADACVERKRAAREEAHQFSCWVDEHYPWRRRA